MKIGLIDVDGAKTFPNIALMKLSAYHKGQGDCVEWYSPFEWYDRVYLSKVFSFSPDYDYVINAKEIIRGGVWVLHHNGEWQGGLSPRKGYTTIPRDRAYLPRLFPISSTNKRYRLRLSHKGLSKRLRLLYSGEERRQMIP